MSICTLRIPSRSIGLVGMHIKYLVMLVALVQQSVSWRRSLAYCPRLDSSTTKGALVCLSSLTMDLLALNGWLIEKSVLGNRHFLCLKPMIVAIQGFRRLWVSSSLVLCACLMCFCHFLLYCISCVSWANVRVLPSPYNLSTRSTIAASMWIELLSRQSRYQRIMCSSVLVCFLCCFAFVEELVDWIHFLDSWM